MRNIALVLLLFSFSEVLAQVGSGTDVTWQQLDTRRIEVTTTGMYILGVWAVGNLAINPILASRSSGAERHFYQMNTMWNVVNIGLAGASLWQSARGGSVSPTWLAAFNEQHSIEKIFLVNTALDVAYMAGGLYMIERGKNSLTNGPRLTGFGRGVLLQGGFLFVFDLGMYLVLHGHQKEWAQLLGNISIGPGGIGMVFPVR